MPKPNFRAAVQSALSAHGWTRYRLAEEAGVSKSQVVEWLAGSRDLRTSSLERITKALGLELRPFRV